MKTAKYSIFDLYELKFRAYVETFKIESLSFKLVCICLFLEYVRPQSLYPALSIIPWSQIAILATIATLITNRENRKREKLGKTLKEEYYLTPLFMLFFIHCIFSSAFAFSSEYAFENIKVIASWIIFYLLIISIVNTEKRFLFFLALFFLCNLKMSQFGFRAWVMRGFSFSSWGVGGSPGWFANSGEFGIQMCIFFPLASATIYALKPYLTKTRFRISLLLPITAAGSVVATSSRGALLGLFVVIALYTLRRGEILKKLLLGSFLIALIYIVTPSEFRERFQTAGTDKTSVTRLEYWKNGKEMADEHPILGIGYMNWVIYYRENYFNPTLYRRVEVAHNTFVEAMAELGYVGLAIFLIMCFSSFKLNTATKRIGTASGNNLYIYLPIGFNIALAGLFVTTFFIAALYYPFYWIHFALTVSLNKAAKHNAATILEQNYNHELKKNQSQQPMPI